MLIIIVADDHKVKYVGGEARVIDGHKCSRMMIQISSFKVDHHSNR